jgi:hypothetical protein
MKIVLGLAHWTGGGIEQYLEMELDDILEWCEVLQKLAK